MDTNSARESAVAGWILGVLMGLVALVALVMMSQAQDATFLLFAILLFAFAVLMIFATITRHTRARAPH